ncbi:MAG: hypothetical protein DCC58_05620 [Chloroflexi bacterium]|nr:MAG: hypothetical protein DCC58_05620 [Chloroflexota bacterium]
MNARDGLVRIRERLVENDARPSTLKLVDTMIDRASDAATEGVQATQAQLIRLLIRTPAANSDVGIYDDLVRLEAEVQEASARRMAEAEAAANRPLPKSRKYYKQQKQQNKRARG